MQPLAMDAQTVALYHFDEGDGNEARSACGDPSLTLRARAAAWGPRPGGGAVARFRRREDDADLFVGPVNHPKLHLRPCTEAWTVEAWVRLADRGGREKRGTTYVNICSTDDEGFGLGGRRGGWIFALANHDRLYAPDAAGAGHDALREDGVAPSARFMGSLRGRDPNQGTSGILYPRDDVPGTAYAGVDRACFIHDNEWHHVAWQFRYADQTHYFLIDRHLVSRLQLPSAAKPLTEIINDAVCEVPFVVGGFRHSQDPPFFPGYGNLAGEIAELRLSSAMRYPVAETLSIVKHRGAVADDLALVASEGLPYRSAFTADAARGPVRWRLAEGELPAGLTLDPATGILGGTPERAAPPARVVLQATDRAGATDRHEIAVAVAGPRLRQRSLPPAFVGRVYEAPLAADHLAPPLAWTLVDGALPGGLTLDAARGAVLGTPSAPTGSRPAGCRVRVTDNRGARAEAELSLAVLPAALAPLCPDAATVFLYDWRGEDARPVRDAAGDPELDLDWTNMGGDRRVWWPGREGRFPQETGHGEHGFASLAVDHDKHNLRTCPEGWTVEAWVRRGGPFTAFGREETERTHRFDYGHICGTYDSTEQGVWELYLSELGAPERGMAPGAHFFGATAEQALRDLHPWSRPEGIVGEAQAAGIRDTEWHHVAWQYEAAADRHRLFLDGRRIWEMTSPDGRRLVNNRRHNAQFSVFSRLTGYVVRGRDQAGEKRGNFNWLGWGNFFGQIGEIRVSATQRYG